MALAGPRSRRDRNTPSQRFLEIAIIGGGPTGVALAGAIAELSRYMPLRDFRAIDPGSTRVTLVEAGPRPLSRFTEEMSAYAKARLQRLGVTVRTGEPVEEIGPPRSR